MSATAMTSAVYPWSAIFAPADLELEIIREERRQERIDSILEEDRLRAEARRQNLEDPASSTIFILLPAEHPDTATGSEVNSAESTLDFYY